MVIIGKRRTQCPIAKPPSTSRIRNRKKRPPNISAASVSGPASQTGTEPTAPTSPELAGFWGEGLPPRLFDNEKDDEARRVQPKNTAGQKTSTRNR